MTEIGTATKWRPPQLVRAISIALVRRGDALLVMRVCDDAGHTKGWRPIGGTIELGERAAETVVREIKEELDVGVESVRFLSVLENIYEHEGAKGHELVMVHAVMLHSRAYERDAFHFTDGGVDIEVQWVSLDEFRSGNVALFPTGLLELIA